jgi:hypothetical protein
MHDVEGLLGAHAALSERLGELEPAAPCGDVLAAREGLGGHALAEQDAVDRQSIASRPKNATSTLRLRSSWTALLWKCSGASD